MLGYNYGRAQTAWGVVRRGGWPLTEGCPLALRPPPAASRYKPVTLCTDI